MNIKKRWIYILAGFAFFLAGCNGKAETERTEYAVYYLDREETHINAAAYEAAAGKDDRETLVYELLGQMQTQTEEIECVPVISGFHVKECFFRESQITLNLSEEYEMLSPAKEVLVRAAIVKTLTQVEGVELVALQVNGKNLLDATGNTVGVMSKDTFIDNTGEDMKKYEEVTLTLYFASTTGDKLIKVNRTMRYNTNIALEKLVVEQLVYGPVEKKGKNNTAAMLASLNPETKIIGVNIKDGICYVNLDNSFLTLPANVTSDVVIYSLVNSLTELPGVLKVQLAVNGETEVSLGEKTLSGLFERNLDLIQTEETEAK